MRIGVDIDGVLNYHYQFLIEYGTKYCVESGKGQLTNLQSGHLRETFGWDTATRDEFWRKYGAIQMCIWPAQTFAAEVISRLRAEGHEIWIITGRNDDDMLIDHMLAPTWEETTRLWLAQNQIEYDEISFNHQATPPTDKGTFCAEHQIEVMIEDDPAYLRVLRGKTLPIVFDTPYNRDSDLLDLERVFSWYDLDRKIKSTGNDIDK